MARKYRNVVKAFFSTPWAIIPEKFDELCEIIEMRHDGVDLTRAEIEARIRRDGQPQPIPSSGGTAVANVFGVLAPRMNMMTEISGGTSMEQLGQFIDQAVADSSIDRILLNIDSPGGNVALMQETADKIVEAGKTKPVIGIANAVAGSAAYKLLVAATEVIMTPSGQVGSVGVLAAHRDTTAAEEKLGVNVQVFRVPENKAEGAFGKPLSESAIEHRMNLISSYYETFSSFVADRRGVPLRMVQSEFGRVFTADTALQMGMVDRVASLDTVLRELGIGQSASSPSGRPAFSMEGINMNPKLFGALVRAGMCEITATEEQANSALQRFFAAKGTDVPESDDDKIAKIQEHVSSATPVAAPPVAPVSPSTVPVSADGDRASQIMAAVKIASLPEGTDRLAFAQELIADRNLSLPQALDRIQTAIADNTPQSTTPAIVPTGSHVDNLQAAARDAVLLRSFGHNRPRQVWSMQEREYVDWTPARGSSSGVLQSLPRLAEECVLAQGVDRGQLLRLSSQQIAQIAMGADPRSFGISASSDGPAYNVSGMFNDILLDAANVMARASYEEVPVTFTTWARQAESIADFKNVHKIIGGEIPDPKAIPEDGEFEETTISEARETYKLVVWGSVFSLTWQMVVNDQLGEFMKIPNKQATSMRRKQNKLVYGILKDNPTLNADSVALFDNTSHTNDTTGAVSDYTAAFNTMRQKMAEQTGLDTGTTLNLDPRFVLYPPAIAGTIEQFLSSAADPSAGGSAVGSAGVNNIWQGRLQPVQEAQLGAAQGGSDTAFYHVADNNQIDTIEYAYLQGLETPALDRVEAFDRLAVRHRIYQAFATKAIDYRGLQRHTGA